LGSEEESRNREIDKFVKNNDQASMAGLIRSFSEKSPEFSKFSLFVKVRSMPKSSELRHSSLMELVAGRILPFNFSSKVHLAGEFARDPTLYCSYVNAFATYVVSQLLYFQADIDPEILKDYKKAFSTFHDDIRSHIRSITAIRAGNNMHRTASHTYDDALSACLFSYYYSFHLASNTENQGYGLDLAALDPELRMPMFNHLVFQLVTADDQGYIYILYRALTDLFEGEEPGMAISPENAAVIARKLMKLKTSAPNLNIDKIYSHGAFKEVHRAASEEVNYARSG